MAAVEAQRRDPISSVPVMVAQTGNRGVRQMVPLLIQRQAPQQQVVPMQVAQHVGVQPGMQLVAVQPQAMQQQQRPLQQPVAMIPVQRPVQPQQVLVRQRQQPQQQQQQQPQQQFRIVQPVMQTAPVQSQQHRILVPSMQVVKQQQPQQMQKPAPTHTVQRVPTPPVQHQPTAAAPMQPVPVKSALQQFMNMNGLGKMQMQAVQMQQQRAQQQQQQQQQQVAPRVGSGDSLDMLKEPKGSPFNWGSFSDNTNVAAALAAANDDYDDLSLLIASEINSSQ